MNYQRREFLKATTVAVAAAGMSRAVVLDAEGDHSDLVITFAGLCAFVPQKDSLKVGLLNARYNQGLGLHEHTPILVARKCDVYGGAPAEGMRLDKWVAAWTDQHAAELSWWRLAGLQVSVPNSKPGKPGTGIFNTSMNRVGSITHALDGSGYDYPEKNPLDADWDQIKDPLTRISCLVTLCRGRIKNGPAKIHKAKDIDWKFKDSRNPPHEAHTQKLTDRVRYELDRKAQVHLIQLGQKHVLLKSADRRSELYCWILNVPFARCIESPKYGPKGALHHFAAYYDLLHDYIHIKQRPLPTTDKEYAKSCAEKPSKHAFDATTGGTLPPSGSFRSTDSVYCPGGFF